MKKSWGGKLATIGRIVFILSAAPFSVAFAQPRNINEIVTVFENLANVIARIFWIAAVVATIYAAFLFLTAGGDSEKVSKAKRQIWYAVIAIIIGLMAFGLPALIENILTPRSRV